MSVGTFWPTIGKANPLTQEHLWEAQQTIDDDVLWRLGKDGDQVFLNRSVPLSSNEELANVIIGTSYHRGYRADILIISNITPDGGLAILVNDGGDSLEVLSVDASFGLLYIGYGMKGIIIRAATDKDVTVGTLGIGDLLLQANGATLVTLDGGTGQVEIGATLDLHSNDLLQVGNAASDWDSTSLRSAVDVFVADGKGVVIGHTVKVQVSLNGSSGITPESQVLGTSTNDSAFLVAEFTTQNAEGPTIGLLKGANASIGGFSGVSNGEHLGGINWYVDDSTDYLSIVAEIRADSESDASENTVSGRLVFLTTNAGIDPIERLRIDKDGVVILGSGEGALVNHSALGNIFRAPDHPGGTDTDSPGADLTDSPGLGTGDADVGRRIFELPIVVGSGTDRQTRAERLALDMMTSTTVLTMAAAQAMTITTAAGDLTLDPSGAVRITDTKGLTTGLVDDDYFFIGAVDNGPNTITELLRFQGAAVPYAKWAQGYFMTEQASALPDIDGDGQWWVMNLQGTAPMFTGDTGLDTSLIGVIFVGVADHTNNTSDTEDTLIPTGKGTVTIPADTLAIGDTIRITARGIYGSKATGAGTLTNRVKFGATVLCGHVETLNNNETNEGWKLDIDITVRTLGATGTVQCQGHWMHEYEQAGETTDMGAFEATTTVTIDTTGALVIDFTNQFSLSDVANTITLTNIIIEIIKAPGA